MSEAIGIEWGQVGDCVQSVCDNTVINCDQFLIICCLILQIDHCLDTQQSTLTTYIQSPDRTS